MVQDAHFLFFERGGVTRTGISRALKTPHWGVFARRTCGGRRLSIPVQVTRSEAY